MSTWCDKHHIRMTGGSCSECVFDWMKDGVKSACKDFQKETSKAILMKFYNKSVSAKIADEKEWHRKFAWLPVRVSENCVVWLETVERRCVRYHRDGDPEWEYR